MWFDRVVLRPGAAGPAVAEARRRLRKLGFIFPPGSDARPYDEALAAAVARFQAACGLRPDGVVGPATWRRLLEDRLGPAGRCRGAGPETPPSPGEEAAPWAPPAGDAASPWAPAAGAAAAGASIHVSLAERRLTLRWRPPGTDEADARELSFPVAVGRAASPTPAGRYEVSELILHPGPPLGTRWIRLRPGACSIHGTDEPWTVGQAATPGCIRMYNKDVEFVFHRLAPGDPALIA